MMSTVFQQLKEEGVEEGIEIGVMEGEEKNKLKIAFNCLIKGMDTWTIAEITELPIERIEALKAAIRRDNSVHV
ncbi:MAG TPA: hypothetical protein VK469_15255 [Candidatus Kapabacteria bacterium]|nr:hypothetical protein [Candidatus Kapabacteria bacterium]